MDPPSSPLRLSPGSSCSSTLVLTPAPLPPLRGPAPKGPLQPHITNLPRRRRPTLRISAPVVAGASAPASPSSSRAADSSYVPSPIQLPLLPPLPFPLSAGPLPPPFDPAPETETESASSASSASPAESAPGPAAPRLPPRGHLQPAHANVPRRTKPLSAACRRRARSVQELGRASGVFVALGCGEGADAREFGAVVRIVGLDGVGDNVMEDKAGGAVVRFVAASTRDDGVPSLAPAQLRAACAFVRAQQGRRVLITAPRAHAADALGVGVCCVAGAALDIPGDDMDADSGTDSHFDADLDWDSGAEAQADADAECVRRLVMRWHDLPAPASSSSTSSSTGEDDEDEDGGGGGGGLKDAWRGLLSRAGMDYLAAAVREPTLATDA